MKIVYIGPFSDGELFDSERSYPFKRGVSTAVPDPFGKKVLAEQGDPPIWVDEGNPLADEAAEAAAALLTDKEKN
jgi:hypothetical protein